ncbi:TolC family protein [Acinetobacter pullicarnis]|uniref:TolC family protein n=1 Tax=Acinetobacter pullicarnis TaxID=2576829 RepID=UPI0011212569|nr:TolC family protein [Acinetobacter pullicarnis]
MPIKIHPAFDKNALFQWCTLQRSLVAALGLAVCAFTHAEDLSYAQAEQSFLTQSFSSQASEALQQAAQLEAQAVKGLGLPRVDLNVRAYAFHSQVDVPLEKFKNNLDNNLSQNINNQIDQSGNIPNDIQGPIKAGIGQAIHDGVGMIPNKANISLEDQVIRPTVSVMMPIYTGGITSTTKEMANIRAQRSQLSTQQQQDLQRFELIQAYFNVQLQQKLMQSSRFNFDAVQRHYDNALKLERQGFINKGQRMQFEVAKNNAERLLQNTDSTLRSSLFQLNNLLQTQQVGRLTTPLFVNSTQNQSLMSLLKSYQEQSALIRKMQMDTQLANSNIKIQSAAKKPSIFAFGEYSLDDKNNWIVGVMARYNLFSGIDSNKNIQAAELQRYASELLTERAKQEIENIIYRSYNEAHTAQATHLLLQRNIKAAQENLRIQELSYKESMGTATEVIDAQNMLNALDSEMALNAYRYVMSLATLLQSHGSIASFQSYVNQPNTHFIR